MTRHYFDIMDGKSFWRDAEGTECEGFEAIRKEAMHALPEIAEASIPNDGDQQAFTILVRTRVT